jgi:hydrogenase maturation protein HypF
MGVGENGSRLPEVALVARHIELTGVVQGVGFRPFVYNLAARHELRGWVRNTSSGVVIEVEGPAHDVFAFTSELSAQAPPRARIERLTVTEIAPNGLGVFAIRESLIQPNAYQLVSPDIATCPDCLGELFDPCDRRYGYPFINCTNCGPRFTIIEGIPYDRPATTMHEFRMCAECEAEYDDPGNRRFHAQPNACPVCGPHLWLVDKAGRPVGSGCPPDAAWRTGAGNDIAVIAEAARLLRCGSILALKGLGGFQLACDASDVAAVDLLRQRKHRPHKPLAVMMASLQEVQRHCHVGSSEAQLLTSPASPIALLRWRQDSRLARNLAPGNLYLGVMLPYTPLHHLLLREVGRPLVMTSGNLSEEPIARDNDEALRGLGQLADCFLLHDRGIHSRYDDSVWFVSLPERPQPVRRARGYAPTPVRLGFDLGRVLACGAELKNTFCLTHDRYAFVSQHIGDLENQETLSHYEGTIELYEDLFRSKPQILACDLHPDYLATRYAAQRAKREHLPLFRVQHHHAHIASCLADNNWPAAGGPVLGVALDGIGYGDDDHVWGGEFLVADYRSFRRFGRLEYLPLPGGDAATRKPYRIALACLQHFLGRIPPLPFAAGVGSDEVRTLLRMVDQGLNTPWTSSAGRLFDAASALLGVCSEVTYEAQAAIDFEMSAGDAEQPASTRLPFHIDLQNGVHVVRLRPLFEALVGAVQASHPVAQVSAAFHHTIASMVAQMCELARQDTGLQEVALSGGCFQNRRLLRDTVALLEAASFRVFVHGQVPCNDGGLSLGQAVVAHFLNGGKA